MSDRPDIPQNHSFTHGSQSMSSTSTPNRDPSARVSSPPVPLAPLEYLQNQRRGSITDPSLHAAAPNPNAKQNINSQLLRQQPTAGASSAHDADPRPSSPFVFGDASVHTPDNNTQLRKLLRSPSLDHDNFRGPSTRASNETASSARTPEGATKPNENDMNVDSEKQRHPQFDYSMRRHSIAADPLSQPQLHGTKRKMSTDRNVFPTVGEEIDPQLVNEQEAPAPKRRGSAIDTQRISQLSLNDRRNSVESRGGWWMNEGRRDSTSSMFSSVSSLGGGYSPAFSGSDSPHGRPPPGIATFAWPSNSHPPDTNPMQHEIDPSSSAPRNFDPAQLAMMPPMNFPNDRRLSASADPLSSSTTGQTRILRSRSRPPSRQMRGIDNSNTSSGQEDPMSTPSPTMSGKQIKDNGITPYSRSPELRVSHKLAERKRRKEMKDLFDELRDQLPADRGMKASKWEILSKAIDFVAQLKQSHQDMAREIDMLRHELDAARQGGMGTFSPSGPPPHVVYSQGPPVPGGYPLPPPPGVMQHPQAPQQQQQQHQDSSRPNSSQNAFPPHGGPPTTQNGNINRSEGPPT